jgi:HAD superfamily hydrolase (TIGR01549 family)
MSVLYPNLELTERKRVTSFYREQLREMEQQLDVSETVRTALESLQKSGFLLAIYSGRVAGELEPLLHDKGIAQYFVSVGSKPAFVKPSGDYFRHLAQTANISRSEMLYVGDSDWDYDMAEDGNVQYYHAGWTNEPNTIACRKPEIVLAALSDLVGLLLFDQAQVSNSGYISNELFEAVRKNQFSFYAGAGISVPSGIGAWEQHYREVLAAWPENLLGQSFL